MHLALHHTAAAHAAARLNLTRGHDGDYRGTCPCCGYGKPTLSLSVRSGGIAVNCVACGDVARIAAIAGLSSELLAPEEPTAAKVTKAVRLCDRAGAAPGTLVEQYLRGRGITIPIPRSIGYIGRQRNWADGRVSPAMVSRVAKVPSPGEPAGLVSSGVHVTFLGEPDSNGCVRKAETKSNKLSLGQLKYGGVWLTDIDAIGADLAVAEGLETALSVQQITGLPTVSALSAAGMRSFRWPPQVRRLWIAADNDETGLQAAKVLLKRALSAGLNAEIKVPAGGKNDFNDVLFMEAE